mmetsp:Transcript_39041/g.68138  ORF Transcript_39041/g.68138 Transcript_39041/m.68138 type:complete len:98 (-) Transcript_39041:400-693(-)
MFSRICRQKMNKKMEAFWSLKCLRENSLSGVFTKAKRKAQIFQKHGAEGIGIFMVNPAFETTPEFSNHIQLCTNNKISSLTALTQTMTQMMKTGRSM